MAAVSVYGVAGALLLVAVLAATAAACVIQSVRRFRRTEVADIETTRSRGARLHAGGCFEIPLSGLNGPDHLLLFVPPTTSAQVDVGYVASPGVARIVHRDKTGVLLYVSGGRWSVSHLAFVHVTDVTTGRPAVLRVPPGMQRARQAVAWTFGVAEDDWAPVAET